MSCSLTFTGDIMCQIQQNGACLTRNGYDYARVFRHAGGLLHGSDFLVGNLETPFAGKEAGYSSVMYSFNTPLEFAEELKRQGFDLVSTANNHCMDRGIGGLYATLDNLDRVGLGHIGTYRTPEERDRPFIREIGGIRVGFIAYTYGTNAFAHHTFLQPGEHHAVNLFMPEETLPGSIHLLDEAKIPGLVRQYYRQPSEIYDQYIAPFIEQLKRDVAACRAAGAEFIIFIMHSGGQYNPLPEDYTLCLSEIIASSGVDLIVGHHPHVVHPIRRVNGVPTAYSLGNFTFTPNSSPVGAGTNAPYSAILRVTLEKAGDAVAIRDMRFAVAKSVFERNGATFVMPVTELLEETRDEAERDMILDDLRGVVNTLLDRPEETPAAPTEWYEVDV